VGDQIACKGLYRSQLTGGIDDACQRVIDSSPASRKIARAPESGRHSCRLSERLAFAQSFVIEEEEELVLTIENLGNDHRSTGSSAELVTLEGRNRLRLAIEIVLGVEVGVAQKLEE